MKMIVALVMALLFIGFILWIMVKTSKENLNKDSNDLPPSPDSSTEEEMRMYSIRYRDDEDKEQVIRLKARNRFDAKFQAFGIHKVGLQSILSVV
jgi:cbb3-type cytochrome oxidase subunit 3